MESLDLSLLAKTSIEELPSLCCQRVSDKELTNGFVHDLMSALGTHIQCKDLELILRVIRLFPQEKEDQLKILTDKQLIDKFGRLKSEYKKIYTNKKKKMAWREKKFEIELKKNLATTEGKKRKDLEDKIMAERESKKRLITEKMSVEAALREVSLDKKILIEEKDKLARVCIEVEKEKVVLRGKLETEGEKNHMMKEKWIEEKNKVKCISDELAKEKDKLIAREQKGKELKREVNLIKFEIAKKDKRMVRHERMVAKEEESIEEEKKMFTLSMDNKMMKIEHDFEAGKIKLENEYRNELERKEREKWALIKKKEKEYAAESKNKIHEWNYEKEKMKKEMEKERLRQKKQQVEEKKKVEKELMKKDQEMEKKKQESLVQLEKEKQEINVQVKEIEENVVIVTTEAELLKEKHNDLLHQYRGALSGKSRLKKSINELKEKNEKVEDIMKEDKVPCKEKKYTRKNNTEINDIRNDIIIVSGSDGLFLEGKKYYGHSSGKKQLTDGKKLSFIPFNQQARFGSVKGRKKIKRNSF